MAESEDPKEELEFYFKLASPLALSLPDAEEKSRAAAWLKRLAESEAGSPRMRADYLRLLVFALQRRRLVGVFAAPPDTSQPLQPFQGGASLTEMMRRLGTQAAAERGAGDRPTVSSMLSHDLKHFLAVQPLPHDRGAHCYMALSPDSYPNWAAKPCDRSRRRSAPAQLQRCPCAPEPAPPPCSPATPQRAPCPAAAPPGAPARVCGPASPSPRTCGCPPDQICWCPRGATPPTGYQSSSLELDSDEDPLVFSWMSQADASAAAEGAALRALTDAVNDSSVQFPALWQSEEEGFEPMEWDSYAQANYRAGRPGEYAGGRVFTTASRMEVRRSEERLPDGSVLALEERTAAGAATRVSPPPAGTCPASPPRGASAAVGATERRVTWSPPPHTSSPCPCPSPSRRRLALPYSPPSPIASPCRRSRSPPCSMTADSLEGSHSRRSGRRSPPCSMTADSLEGSRSRRSGRRTRSPTCCMSPDSIEASRRSSRSPRRSFSAESIVPCPASGQMLDSVTPPSGLRFSGSAGLSRSPCATPSPCPAARRRTSSPLPICPGDGGADIGTYTPPSAPSGIFSGSPCPCSPRSPGIDSVTPPSGVFSGSPCPCSPSGGGIGSYTPPSPPCLSPRSPGIDSVTPPSGVFSGSPCPCSPKRRSPSPPPCSPAPCAPPPCASEPFANIRQPTRFFEPCKERRSSSPPPCSPAPCAPPPCAPEPFANIRQPPRFFEPLKGRRASTPPPCSPPRRSPSPCAPARRSTSPCAPARRSSPCAPAPCAPPPCAPEPYANIQMPKRFFEPRGRRSSTPPPCVPSRRSSSPCAPAPRSSSPCSPAPCAPPPCSPDPYANIPRPTHFFSPRRLAKSPSFKSPSFQYDEDPFYGTGDSIPYELPSPCPAVRSPCPGPLPSLSPSPSPCPPRLRGSVPRNFYRLTDELSPMSRKPRRTGECPARSPQPVCGPPPPPPSPAPCPASTTYEVECVPGGVVRRSFSRSCDSNVPDGQGPVTKTASASFAMTSCLPNPNPEDFSRKPRPVSPSSLWEDMDDDPRNAMPDICGESPFDFLDRSCNRLDFPPDDTFYEFENNPCPVAESTRYFPNTTISSNRPPSPVAICEAPPQPQPQQQPGWIDPVVAMWEEMAQELAEAEGWREPLPGEYPWSFLDRTLPSFSWPPIHPRRRRR